MQWRFSSPSFLLVPWGTDFSFLFTLSSFFLSVSLHLCVRVCGMHRFLQLVKVMSVKAIADLAIPFSHQRPLKKPQAKLQFHLPPLFSHQPLLSSACSTTSALIQHIPRCRLSSQSAAMPFPPPSPPSNFHFLQPSLPPISRPLMRNFLVRSPSRCFCPSIIQIVFLLLYSV